MDYTATPVIGISEILIYLRKSRQDDPSESIEVVLSKHEKILQDYAIKTWGEPIPESNIYREIVSGETISDRPMIQQIMQLIELPNYKAILVVEPQRLSRGDLQDCGRIINSIRYTDTLVITPGKTYNLSEKYDRKFFEMELMRGNDFLEYIKEIMGRGRVAAVMRGCYIGNTPPYGWERIRIEKNYTLAPNPSEFSALLLMYHMYVDDDLGCFMIAKKLDQMGIPPRNGHPNWNPAAVRDILANPVNDGKIRWNRRPSKKTIIDGELKISRPKLDEYICIEGLHGDHITEELHQLYIAAQDKRGRTTRKKPGTNLINPLAGLLYCSCGRAMSFRTYTRQGKQRSNPRFLCDNQHNCHIRSVRYNDIIDAIISILEMHVKDFEIKIHEDAGTSTVVKQRMIENLSNELYRLKAKSDKQKDLLEDGIYTKAEYIQRNAILCKQIENIQLKLDDAKSILPKEIDYKEKITQFSEAISLLQDDKSDTAYTNRLLKSIITRIEYTSEKNPKRNAGNNNTHGGWSNNEFSINVFLKF